MLFVLGHCFFVIFRSLNCLSILFLCFSFPSLYYIPLFFNAPAPNFPPPVCGTSRGKNRTRKPGELGTTAASDGWLSAGAGCTRDCAAFSPEGSQLRPCLLYRPSHVLSLGGGGTVIISHESHFVNTLISCFSFLFACTKWETWDW